MKRSLSGAVCLLAVFVLVPAAAQAASPDRYAMANACFALTSGGKVAGGDVGPFFMKPTALGSYMLFGRKADFLTGTDAGAVTTAADAGDHADWTVDARNEGFTLTLASIKKSLAADASGKLSLVDPASASTFTFAPTGGCAIFPESEVDVTGDPSTSPTPFGEVQGLIDAHMHWMAYEFLGGRAHCGKPWDRYGITHALVDCPDHSVPGSPGNALEAALGGPPVHDTVGWPTFSYWPNPHSLTHEDSYYRWVERAWHGGLRVFVNLFVDNAALCKVYPEKSHDCNEMDTVRLEMARLNALQDYVDAQNGGPGKGWFRLVHSPFEARSAIAAGKLAVVPGIEVSELFDCTVYNGVENCNKDKVDAQLQEVYDAGVRDMELVNKFDNAFVGVAGDNGSTGTVVNNGNKLETGRYWDMQTCQGVDADAHDKDQTTAPDPIARDQLVGGVLGTFASTGAAPVYPAGPHCNTRGLTSLGNYLLTKMMDKGMIIDPDHMSVLARNQTLDLLEARKYSGVVSSHSWSTPDAYPRIYKLGGVITPYAGDSTSFVKEWRALKPLADKRYYWGFGYGADMNGFGSQGDARPDAAKNPVTYPFKSFDGKQTIDKLRTGQRTWDINTDGVANYGLYPDWVEDLRKIAGDEIVKDMGRGAESYLEMWERAVGVPATRCQPARTRLRPTGVGRMGIGLSVEALLRSAGQPVKRGPRAWTYCLQERDGRPAGGVTAVLTPDGASALVVSTGPEHQALGVDTGDSATPLRGRAKRLGPGVLVAPAGKGARYVFGVRRGRVTYVGVAVAPLAASDAVLRPYLRLAGVG